MKRANFYTLLFNLVFIGALVSPAFAVTNLDYASEPPFIGTAVPPMVLTVMGRDHKMYYAAYNDASDLDGDGVLDTTYKNSIDYYGYFDPHKCYAYSANISAGMAGFTPSSVTADKYCNGTKWSGNFLNWLATSRIDALRRVLYGGFRGKDDTNLTILESEYKPEDAHSWGKEYAGFDIPKLTPFADPSGGSMPACKVDWTTPLTSLPTAPPASAPATCDNTGCDPFDVTKPCSYYTLPQKILEVTYDDAGYPAGDPRVYGDSNTDLYNSFDLCATLTWSYIDNFNNADLVNTGACKSVTVGGTSYTTSCKINADHLDTMSRTLITEFEVTDSNKGYWDFAIDGDDGVEMKLGTYDQSTNAWNQTIIVAYYGSHTARTATATSTWNTSPNGYGPTTVAPDYGAGAANYCDDLSSPCGITLPPVHTNVWLDKGWHRMITRLRAYTNADGVVVYYRNPQTRLATRNGQNWIVFGAQSDLAGSTSTPTIITKSPLTLQFKKSATNTVTRSDAGGSFIADGLVSGMTITFSHSPATTDPGPYTISNVAATVLTISSSTNIANNIAATTNYSYTATLTPIVVPVLNYRAPNVPAGDSIRFRDKAFVVNGEPSFTGNPSPNTTSDAFGRIPDCGKHLLFCVTSTKAETATDTASPIIKVLKKSTNRIWEWASTERAVCSGTETAAGYQHLLDTAAHYGDTAYYDTFYDRVQVCDTALGIAALESNCKLYPGGGGTYKPAGLFQKYGESEKTVCSKTFKDCNTDSDCTSPQTCTALGQMFFGLMTGSYTKNTSGGVLRSNIDSLSHQVDNKNVGQLKSPGGAAGADGFPISNLDRLRMKGFSYTDFSYNENCGWIETRSINEGECRMWGNPIAEMMYEGVRYFAGKGKPTASYSAGTGAAGTDDVILNLTNQGDPTNNWIKPYDKFPSCSKPFMIVMSDVNPSYDSDQLPGVDTSFETSPAFTGDLTGLTSVKDMTDTIGKTEGINGTNIFIGQSSSATDGLCTSKLAGPTAGDNTSGLGSVRGLCPEEPTKKGSYYSAAVAHYGKTLFGTNNLITTGTVTSNMPNITTYSVALVSPVPEINIPVPGSTAKVCSNDKTLTCAADTDCTSPGTCKAKFNVKVVPIGKSISGCASVNDYCAKKCTVDYNISGDNTSGLKITNCSSDAFCPTNQIVGFYVDTLNDTNGKFRVSFEDSEQGADHEMDAIVEYSYQVNTFTNTITISLNSAYAAGCIDQMLGFVISGTVNQDGTYLAVRDLDSGTTDADTPAKISGMPTYWSKTFTPSTTGAATQFIHDPLWYSAKWGGFEDSDGDNIPFTDATCGTATPNTKCQEWDKVNNVTGEEKPDGVPDNYFLVTNPLKLEQQLTKVFADILKKSASGTSVSILATSAEGEGSLYQAYFYPEKIMADGTKRNWLGYVRGLFLDSYGNLREDTNHDGRLVFTDDRIIVMKMDQFNNVTADLFKGTKEDGTMDDPTTPDKTVTVDEINALWEGGAQLAKKDKATRNIYTWVDKDNDGVVDNGDFSSISGEAFEFVDTNAAALRPYTGITGSSVADTATAANLINFVRGTSVSGLRDRCMPITDNTDIETGCVGKSDRIWGLGDIVYSTPTTVAGPKEQYDQIYGEASYIDFRNKYISRRNIIYLGGNDGLLHAFNAGMYHAGDDSSTPAIEHGWFTPNPDTDSGWPATTALGDELWAFIPYDNLPHLQWLKSGTYSHVYYVDLKPKATDVRMFNDALTGYSGGIDGQSGASHPNGWGTILIVGMRLGGGAMSVTTDFGSGANTTRTFKSAYYAFDVTDPERKPKLLWRFTDTNLGFSTPYPAVAHMGKTAATERWYMVVGSGPDNNVPNGTRGYDGSSSQAGQIYIVDLKTGTLTKNFTVDAKTFMGDPTVIDGDLDFVADVIYIGSAINLTGTNTSGKVFRINTNGDANAANWAISTLINENRPLLVGPSVAIDRFNNHWVMFGTGRLWSKVDRANTDQQTLYGIKDACWKENSVTKPCSTTYALSDLMNTTNFTVCSGPAGGKIYDSASQTCGTGTSIYNSYAEMLKDIRTTKGWYLNLPSTGSPTERALSKSVIIGGITLFTTFTPDSDACAFQGNSALYGLYFETGTAYVKPVLGTEGTGASQTINRKKSLGKGLPTTVGIAIGKATKGFIQTSTGAIVEIDTEPGFGVRSGAEGWKEKGGGTSGVEELYKHIVK